MLRNKRILGTYLITFILISVCIFLLLGSMIPKLNESLETYDRINSVYADSKIDFVIPSPTQAQLDEMAQMEHINSVFACHSIYSTFSIRNINKSAYILLVDNADSLESTMFKSSRLVASRGEFTSSSLLIDESYARQNGLSLGDQVTWNISGTENVTLTVDAIYYTNEIDDVQVVIFNTGVQKEIIDRLIAGKPLTIGSAYIDSSDCEQTKEMLKSYKPLGLLKTPNDFELYSDYEIYLERFNQTDYFPQIIQGENYKIEHEGTATMHKENASKTTFLTAALSFVIPFILSALITFALGLGKYAITQIRDGFSKKQIHARIALGGVAVACGASLCNVFACLIYAMKDSTTIWIFALCSAIAVATTTVARLAIINKSIKVQKK